ncbi:hypothetical protein PIB30_033188 [Stylosanthes scabra]|uniref:RNase H type-1 domain-containing protein n=1 Tax=Stylosanthes scabra TaxID=79078 RepID=A0ABU6QBV2_9FABA|nr:hypothetical protein [Stylosanthes scabra]
MDNKAIFESIYTWARAGIMDKSRNQKLLNTVSFFVLGLEQSGRSNQPQTVASTTRRQRNATSNPPPRGWIKCNVDAAFSLSSCRGIGATMFRDHEGTLLTSSTVNLFCSFALAAEAMALR